VSTIHLPPKAPAILRWQAEGCHFQRVDLAPGKPLEFNKVVHDEIVILAFSGSVWRSTQHGRTYLETPDCVVIRDAGQVFSTTMTQIDSGSGSVCREVHIPPARLRELYDRSENSLPRLDFSRPVLQSKWLAQLLFRTHALFEAGGCTLEATSYLAWLIGALARETSGQAIKPVRKAGTRRSQLVIEYLRAHFDQKITLQALAKLTDANPYVLLRQFRSEIGVTPHDYLQAYRVYRAKQFMQNGIPLADVALLCGFSDQSHFNRQFKQRLGITPRRFLFAEPRPSILSNRL
jgi:AraC-like DNA-binding protein